MGRYNGYTYVRQNLLNTPCIKSFGAFVGDGGITPGWTAVNSRKTAINGLKAMLYSAVGGGILAGTGGGAVYFGSDGTELTQQYSGGGSSPFAFEFTKKSDMGAVLFSGNTYTALSKGVLQHGQLPHKLNCGVMRCGRLFGGDADDGYLLRWSGEGGFNDWAEGISGAGSLALEPFGGRILNVFDFEEQLIILRESAITRFAASGNPENFRVAGTVTVPPVSNGTAIRMDTCILFFSDFGLMRYRNGGVERLNCAISDDLKTATFAYGYQSRFYFICGTSKSLERELVYVYDNATGKCQIIDLEAYFIANDGTSVIIYTDSAIYRAYYAVGTAKYSVRTGEMDFGTAKRKLLTVLEVDCDEGVTVQVSNGRRTRTVNSPNGRTRLIMRGAQFEVTFASATGAVRSAYLTAEVIK